MLENSPVGKPIPIDVIEESLYEVRRKIYPRSVSGLFARWRLILVIATQLLFYGLPWVSWNGRQAILFDLVQRKFYIFGLVLWPQDIIYLTLLLILSALALFLFTAIAGRLFCGYACPQTVYTEIFMWIERQVEGDRFARIRLDGEEWPWSFRKWRLKVTKHFLWLLIAFWTGFTFIGYFTPIDSLGAALVHLTLGPWQTFWLCFYAFATWGNAGFMREQVCKYMCPYARFQSVMVDKDTFLVTYDKVRGDPRGSRSKSVDHTALGLGDCVDCSICVQVCPTGIDIRDGLQYMCIGCGACIDACNQVMEKVNYPKGLIRYTTENAVEFKESNQSAIRHILRPRVLIYTAFIVILTSAFMFSLVTRNPLRVDVMRDRGALAREVDGARIENVYRIQMMNASEHPLKVSMQAKGLEDLMILNSQGNEVKEIIVEPASNQLLPVKVSAKIGQDAPGTYPIQFDVSAQEQDGAKLIIHTRDEKSSFIIPR
ncbi:cytochrome c oxidase accessory protein CcoG [Polynucleobacter sphagniphilus]|jgi:cytochrome c oxidase accessory protein FixG|uniref:cytochrome c oxidase accessory protein CcoG n=1 Tax=Polynucleobacter sphagniphilus TaxID=1743169 RepID=UPI00096BAD9A|nr:cytochrome c oxidase accessory protein CcoG [Polynucleobacter sphagniphilus]MDF9788875.1 cytochrome c oxidase accessory protein FixG [Polynucleobacter sphagniphilus]MDH6154628.1 cytochrome c oxidase accessory protein FixG [Polynucleobacter sphagniphilus]MDH6241393.1 cytochrome c oxidase accessory protein FixG [Polynucleobacter sphagniphilus]MDH6249991.1 cytochrome c oxidase accessory protein FixG [Polynucleobacter sphagniphilus]MDH6302285.1 cytochrome c oxidase accessory protein FixG [Polyn